MDGIYIHIPFCASKCPYCDFYSLVSDEALRESYKNKLIKAIESCPFILHADTVYFGGGTPNLMGEKFLLEILDAAYKKFNLSSGSEITLEANPSFQDLDMFQNLKKGGFTRISFGVQSSSNDTLKILGRRHNFQEAASAVYSAEKAGFQHISVDLMMSVPSQTEQQLLKDIDNFSSLPVDHISSYLLKLEPGTPFYKRYPDTDEDFAADSYLLAVKALEEKGFHQYEISNFAKNREAMSRHNLKYWLLDDYLGIGPSAHSLIKNRRFYFDRDLKGFLSSENVWENTKFESVGNTEEEKIMLNLRLTDGLDLKTLKKDTSHLKKKCEEFAKIKMGKLEGDIFSLTPQGFLLSNYIIEQCIESYEE